MSIEALPRTTICLMGASQVLTDPAAVVKELIDNALDARATSICVEISANTIDSIQVRDNGHGICPEDRKLIFKRHCTSKLRSYEEIKTVGHKFLGFRGEALAAASELSDSITITTRVDGEERASRIEMRLSGVPEREKYCCHTLGTTVRLQHLFKNLPVRRQTVLKATSKHIRKIKRSLQAHALARPGIRFSLKILDHGKNREGWIYVPQGPLKKMKHTVCGAIGKDCANECEEVSFAADGFHFQVFLPGRACNLSKISGFGQFISVDLRPVCAQRGIFKNVVKIFKEHLERFHKSEVKDPFLCMNMVCPSASYDPNIEPAKDDVMFENGMRILDFIKNLFSTFYQNLDQNSAFLLPSSLSGHSLKSSAPEFTTEPNAHILQLLRLQGDCEARETSGQDSGSSLDYNPLAVSKYRSLPLSHDSLSPPVETPFPAPKVATQDAFQSPYLPRSASIFKESTRQSNATEGGFSSTESIEPLSGTRQGELQVHEVFRTSRSVRQLDLSSFLGTAQATTPSFCLRSEQQPKFLASPLLQCSEFSDAPVSIMTRQRASLSAVANLPFRNMPREWRTHNLLYLSNSSTDLRNIYVYMRTLGPNSIGRVADENVVASLRYPRPTMNELNMWEVRINEYLTLET